MTEPVFHSALYRTHYPDERHSPDISLSLLAQGRAMSSCLRFAPGYAALRVTAGDCIPCRSWLCSWSGPSVLSPSWYYMNPAGCEGFPTSTLIMPFFNIFKSKRARSKSLPKAPERYLHESEFYDQPSAYGPRSTSGFSRSARLTQGHAGFMAQRYPSDGSSFYNSCPDRFHAAPTSDQL